MTNHDARPAGPCTAGHVAVGDTVPTTDGGCLICQTEAARDGARVFSDERWAAGVVEGYAVPGWIALWARPHLVGLAGLDRGHLETFGRRARQLSLAIGDATGAPVTYCMIFGEANPHFHALFVPRPDETPADRRTGDILKLRHEIADLQASRACAQDIRAAFLRRSSDALNEPS